MGNNDHNGTFSTVEFIIPTNKESGVGRARIEVDSIWVSEIHGNYVLPPRPQIRVVDSNVCFALIRECPGGIP